MNEPTMNRCAACGEVKGIEQKLRDYLMKMKADRNIIEQEILFCKRHNLFEEERWIRRKLDDMTSVYVNIHNDVLGEYF